MPPRKELCRNFQRGSCQYGDRCKFVHAAPQQSKPNPFGFGTQNSTPFQRSNQQQQMPNPFGFGVQNNTQSRGANDFGLKPNQFKPFENKWTRFSPINNSGASASQRPDNKPQAAEHKCTDAETCKRIIVEDLETEKPQWKLTCYGHSRYGPCDIVGDICYEELRSLAYDDAKNGKNLQLIVDRERSLLNSKLIEFQNLIQKPSVVSSAPTHVPVSHNGFSPQASTFGQLSGLLSTRSTAVSNYTFGQPSAFQNNSQPSNMFQTNNPPFNTSGAFGSQIPQQPLQSSYSFGPPSSNNSAMSAPGNPFATLANSSQTVNASEEQLNFFNSAHQLVNNSQKEKTNADDSIWRKTEWKWNVGEIPEDAPPDVYIH